MTPRNDDSHRLSQTENKELVPARLSLETLERKLETSRLMAFQSYVDGDKPGVVDRFVTTWKYNSTKYFDRKYNIGEYQI